MRSAFLSIVAVAAMGSDSRAWRAGRASRCCADRAGHARGPQSRLCRHVRRADGSDGGSSTARCRFRERLAARPCGEWSVPDCSDVLRVCAMRADDEPCSSFRRRRAPPASRLVLLGGVHKMSSLIQWAKIQIVDEEQGRVVFDRLVTFRGDTDEAWQKAESFIAREILQSAPTFGDQTGARQWGTGEAGFSDPWIARARRRCADPPDLLGWRRWTPPATAPIPRPPRALRR